MIAAVVGSIVAFVIYRYVPFSDPVEVVGPALMRGYSEAAEQWGLYGFWIATVVTGVAISLYGINWQSPVAQNAAAVSLLLLLSLPWIVPRPVFIGVSLATWTMVYVCGHLGSSVIESRFGPLRLPWIAMLCWGVCYYETVSEIVRQPQLGLRVVAATAIVAVVLHFWVKPNSSTVSRGALLAVMIGVLWRMRITSDGEFALVLSAALAYQLGVVAARETGSIWPWRIWSLFVLATLLTIFGFGEQGDIEIRLRCGLAGLGLCALLRCLMRDWDVRRRFKEFTENRAWPNVSRWWIAGAACALAVWHPFQAPLILLALGLYLVSPSSGPRRLRFWPAIGMGLLLVLAVVPVLRLVSLDLFHDSYNITCAWEFESGRTLYTEMLPIRSYQFFVTWLSRRILPQTVDAYLLTFSVLQVLPVLGAFALSLVWTRGSVPWSLLSSAIVMAFSDLDSRQGVHLLIAATMLVALDRDRWQTWVVIGINSILAGCSGYDTLSPFAAATTLTLFFVPDSPRAATPPTLFRRVLRATQGALLAVVPFSLLIAVWQGPRAAIEYWLVLRDFAAHFNAFSGLPVQWTDLACRFLIGFFLAVLVVWVTIGEVYWATMSPARRRFWLFLMIQFGFLMHRGVGRSDQSHLKDLIISSLVLVSIGLFECCRKLRQDGWVRDRVQVSDAGWVVLGVVLVFGAPWRIASELHLSVMSQVGPVLRGLDTVPLGEVPYVQQTVLPDETYWTIENTSSNFANHRHSPTRHSLAHIICSPSEQRRVIADMRLRPPRLIEWPTKGIRTMHGPDKTLNAGNFATVSVFQSHDEISALLRYWLIFEELLPRYRPTKLPGFLEPAPEDWTGMTQIAPRLNKELLCQRMPLVWGARRAPSLVERAQVRTQLPKFHQLTPDTSGPFRGRKGWEVNVDLAPRQFNYLQVTFAATEAATAEPDSSALLQFTPDKWDIQTSSMSFTCDTDGRPHTYLLPVGCAPGWIWRSHISRLRLVAPQGGQLSAPQVEVWSVDELTQ